MAELIKLKNSNPLQKYPVDADQLNNNFEAVRSESGAAAIQNTIESSGQVYSEAFPEQLAKAIVQYVLSASIFTESGNTTNEYVLTSRGGFALPYSYTYGMVVSFITTRTNTGGCTLQIGDAQKYPILLNDAKLKPGYIQTNTIISFMFMGDHWVPAATPASLADASQSAAAADSAAQTSNEAAIALRLLIQTAAIGYDVNDPLQVSEAVANYVAGVCYRSVYGDGVYSLYPIQSQSSVSGYSDGMTLMFVADATNDVQGPAIKLANKDDGGASSYTVIYDYRGNTLEAGAIQSGEFCILQRKDGAFYLISQFVPTLTMSNGVTVHSISNDITLANDASDALVTEHAVKSYINKQTQTVEKNIIVDAYKNAQGANASLRQVGSHEVQLITAQRNNDNTEGVCQLATLPTGNTMVFTSSNASIANNAISKLSEVYWETEKYGYDIDNISRIVVGRGTGTPYITIQKDETQEEGDQKPVYKDTPRVVEFIGFANLTKLPTQVRIKFTDANHTPKNVVAEVCTTNSTSASGVWNALSDQGDEGMNYGDLTIHDTDELGYYTLSIPSYVISGDNLQVFNPTNPFSLRITIDEVENQFPTTAQLEDVNYDPNTDISPDSGAEKYTIQVVDISYSGEWSIVNGSPAVTEQPSVNAPDFTVSFYSGRTTSIENTIYYTQFDQVTDEDGTGLNEVTLSTLPDGYYYMYVTEDINELVAIPRAGLIQAPAAPTPSADNLSYVWLDISTFPYDTYVCTSHVVENELPNGSVSYSTVYEWTRKDVILIGELEYLNNNITSVSSFTSGNMYISSFVPNNGNLQQHVAQHNFGTDVTITIEMECTDADCGYTAGEKITMAPYMMKSYTINTPEDADPTLTESRSYLQLVSSSLTTTVLYQALSVVHKTTGVFTPISNNKWKMYVYIDKD